MWFRRKVQPPVRKKREPRTWSIPKEHAPEVLRLYDDMMKRIHKVLPRYLFWQKIVEILDDTRGIAIRTERVSDWRCIRLVEVVADDDFADESDATSTPTTDQQPKRPITKTAEGWCAPVEKEHTEHLKASAEAERVLGELEHKLDGDGARWTGKSEITNG